MSFFRASALVSLALLAACASNPGAPSASATKSGPLAGKVPDIVDDTNDLGLGKGWYLFETFGGQSFRWVDNNAEIVVKNPRTNVKDVALELEAGPSLGTKKFTLQIVENGKVLSSIPISGHAHVVAAAPVRPGTPTTFALHVNGGGKTHLRSAHSQLSRLHRSRRRHRRSEQRRYARRKLERRRTVRGPNVPLGRQRRRVYDYRERRCIAKASDRNAARPRIRRSSAMIGVRNAAGSDGCND